MSSDNIIELSYNSNILAGASFTTEKVITGQYVSLNMTVKSDVTIELTTQFSGDGTYWDYNITSLVAPDTNRIITVPVQAKWIRLAITNVSASPSTFLRVYTYGTPTNSSVLAQLSKIGNLNPTVDIGNLPANFATPCTIQQYKFMSGPTNPTSSAFISLFPTLYISDSGAAGPTYTYANQKLTVLANNTVNTFVDVLDVPMQIPTGAAIVKFTASYLTTTDSTLGGTALVGVSSNFGDRIAIGYFSTSPLTLQGWGLFISPAGSNSFISRADFNIDPCDGSVNLPTLNMAQMNSFEFILTPTGVDVYIKFQNTFSLVHRYSYSSSTTPMFRDYSLGFFMRTLISGSSVCTSGDLAPSCSDWEIQMVGRSNIPLPIRSVCYSRQATNSVNDTNFFTLQNHTLFGATSCLRTVKVYNIRMNRAGGSSTAGFTFQLLKNATLASTSYSAISSYSNVRVTTGALVTVRGELIASVFFNFSDVSMTLPDAYEIRSSDTLTLALSSSAAGTYLVEVSLNIL